LSRVKWEEPKKPVWYQRLEPLKERPGEWGRVYETNKETARKYVWRLIHQPEKVQLPDGRWEFKGEIEGDTGKILARYLGD
jgi:hypothetical protein